MRIIRNITTEMPVILPKPQKGEVDECGRTTTSNESYSKYTESRTEKGGWVITRSYSENRNVFNGEESFYASHNTVREKEGISEYISRSYSRSNGIVTITSSKGTTRTYKECDMPFDEWQFEVDFED